MLHMVQLNHSGDYMEK